MGKEWKIYDSGGHYIGSASESGNDWSLTDGMSLEEKKEYREQIEVTEAGKWLGVHILVAFFVFSVLYIWKIKPIYFQANGLIFDIIVMVVALLVTAVVLQRVFTLVNGKLDMEDTFEVLVPGLLVFVFVAVTLYMTHNSWWFYLLSFVYGFFAVLWFFGFRDL